MIALDGKGMKNSVITALESQEQAALIQWAQHCRVGQYLFAIPNGGLRDKGTARSLKRQGVKPGVSDLFLAYPSGGKHGLFIEMKRKGTGKLSKAQTDFIEQCISVGYEAKVAYGWEEAVKIIEGYLESDGWITVRAPYVLNSRLFHSNV